MLIIERQPVRRYCGECKMWTDSWVSPNGYEACSVCEPPDADGWPLVAECDDACPCGCDQ